MSPYVTSIGSPSESPGQLCYRMAGLIAGYVRDNGLQFQTIAEVRGAVEGALAEFERRVAEPYEQLKLEEGGADPYDGLEQYVTRRLGEQRAENVRRQLASRH